MSIAENGKKSEEEESELPPPPDGGWGWVVVFGSFMIHIISKYYINLFDNISIIFVTYALLDNALIYLPNVRVFDLDKIIIINHAARAQNQIKLLIDFETKSELYTFIYN